MVTAAIGGISSTTSSRILRLLPLLLGLLCCFWTKIMVAAFDCVEAEVRCQRDSNCLLALEAHRVTCGPLGTSLQPSMIEEARLYLGRRGCTSADLNLCHSALVGLQLSHAFNGSCWCHEPTMETRTYHRCLDVHLKIFYHPCIAVINSRVNGRRRQEIEQQEQQRRKEEEEQRRREQWRNYWYQHQQRLSSVAPPAPPPTPSTSTRSTTVTRSVSTTATLSREQIEARRREQERLEYERQLQEHRRRQQEFERQQEERRRQEIEQQRQRSTRVSPPWSTESASGLVTSTRSGSPSTYGRTTPPSYTGHVDIFGATDSAHLSSAPRLEDSSSTSPPDTSDAFSFAETRYTGSTVDAPASSAAVVTPRHRIRHFQEKLEAIGRGEESDDDISAEVIARRHKPSVVATGETINGHAISDFSNLFSPNHLNGLNGEPRQRPKLSVPGEYHWSCTKSLERCLDHVACTRLLELYREKCRVDNQRCVSTDWKSCKEAYEGIRWTGLNNCTCSDDHRLHGPSCHFVELLTAHNQCIDEFKRAGYITDDNGAPFYAGQPPGVGPSASPPGRNSKRPDIPGPSPTTSRNLTTARPTVGTDSNSKPIPVPTKVLPTRKPVVSPTTSSKNATKTTTRSTTTSKPMRLTSPKTTTTSSPRALPGRVPGGPVVPGGAGSRPSATDDIDDDGDDTPEKPERPAVFLPPQRNPAQPVSRRPEITWDEWDRRRVTAPPALPASAAFRQVSNREVALGAHTYRVESTCQMAFSHCHWDDTCSWQLSEIKSYCITMCDKQRCAAAVSRFYKFVSLDFQEGLTFCTCRPHDTECLEYQNLLFPSCLRQMQRHEWRECGDLKQECKNDDRCWSWEEKYFDACRWDPVRGRCAGNPQLCRRAVLGIRGTPLDTDCACLPNSPDCEAIQNALYFRNPCFEESRLTMVPKFTTKRPTTSTSTTTTTTKTTTTTASTTTTTRPPRRRPTTTTTTTTTTTSTALPLPPVGTGDENEEEPESKPTPKPRPVRPPKVTTTRRPRITTTTRKPKTTTQPKEIIRGVTVATAEAPGLADDYYPDETTTVAETVATTTEMTTEVTTTIPTTPTTPPTTTTPTPQCETIDQETRVFKMRASRSIFRVYTDRFTRCSSLCQCSQPYRENQQNIGPPGSYDDSMSIDSDMAISEYDEAKTTTTTTLEPLPEPTLDCHAIDCMADIPCPGGTWLGYGAPAFRMNQDKCTCISGDFVCRRIPQGEVPNELADREGLFLSIGYSQKEVEWLVQRFPHYINEKEVDLPHTPEEFTAEIRKELEKNMQSMSDTPEYPCELVQEFHEGNNYIFQVLRKRRKSQASQQGREDGEAEDKSDDFSIEACRLPVKRLAKALDDDRFRNDVILSVVKEAIVDDRLPYSGCVRNCNAPSLLQFLVLYITSAAVIRWLRQPV